MLEGWVASRVVQLLLYEDQELILKVNLANLASREDRKEDLLRG